MNKRFYKILFIVILMLPICINAVELDGPQITDTVNNCKELLGNNLMKILSFSMSTIRIVACIIAIVNAMIILLPAVVSKDADALKKSETKLITLAIVLVLIILLPTLLTAIGDIFGYDLSCFA